MRNFLTWLTVLLLSLGQLSVVPSYAEPARAPRWHKFCADGVVNIQILADRVEAALKKDSTGKTRVEGCRATPLDFYKAHRENHEDSAPASVGDLPRYYREDLVLQTLPAGTKYWSACKTDTGYIGQCSLRVVGAAGERIWIHKKTRRVVMLGNCANPAGKPEVPQPKEQCVSKFVYLYKGDEHHFGLLGDQPLVKSACVGIRRPGEANYDSVLLDRCHRANCDYSGPSRALGLKAQSSLVVSYVAETEGWYELRLDRAQFWTATESMTSSTIIDCIIRPDGTQSQGMVTDASLFYNGAVSYIGNPPQAARSSVRSGAYVRPVIWSSGGRLSR